MTTLPTRWSLLALLPLAACAGPEESPETTPETTPRTTQPGPPADTVDFDPYYLDPTEVHADTSPRMIVRRVIQDARGTYWLATWCGLVTYDGTTFTNVTKQEGLRPYRCFSLFEDSRGHVWIGTTGGGVYRYDGATFTNFTTRDGLVDDTVLAIAEDADGHLWFGGMGATRYDGSTFTAFDASDGFTSRDVHSIQPGGDGALWFGTRGALFRYDGERFEDFTAARGVAIDPNSYTPALVDRRGHLWFGGSNGLHHFDGTEVRQLFGFPCFSMLEDSEGHVWWTGGEASPGTSALHRFDPADGLANVLTASKRFEVPSPAIFEMHEDRNGDVWMGTGSGAVRVDGRAVHRH